jgi:hypothetical protein
MTLIGFDIHCLLMVLSLSAGSVTILLTRNRFIVRGISRSGRNAFRAHDIIIKAYTINIYYISIPIRTCLHVPTKRRASDGGGSCESHACRNVVRPRIGWYKVHLLFNNTRSYNIIRLLHSITFPFCFFIPSGLLHYIYRTEQCVFRLFPPGHSDRKLVLLLHPTVNSCHRYSTI